MKGLVFVHVTATNNLSRSAETFIKISSKNRGENTSITF